MTPDRFDFDPPPSPTVPAGLTDRITAAAVRDYRVRRTIRRAGWAASTITGVFVIGWLSRPVSPIAPPKDQMAKLVDPFREVDAAFASLSRSAADRVTSTVPVLPTTAGVLPDVGPGPERPVLSGLPVFDPVTGPTQRAVGRFFQDLGSVTGSVRGGL